MKLRLPPIGLAIPPAWDNTSEAAWLSLRDRATRLEETVVAGPNVHHDADSLRPFLREGNVTEVLARVTSARMVRSLTWLWIETGGNCRDTATPDLLAHLANAPSSRGAVHFLARLYFERFDALGEEVLEALLTLLRTLVSRQHRASTGIVAALQARSELLLDSEAPQLLAREARQASLEYSDALRRYGLDGFMDGRFGELLRQYLVLEELLVTPMDVPSALLADVQRAEVHDSPHRRGQLFGHAVLAAMIDRVGDDIPPVPWRTAVLAIGDDPRRTYADSYRKWWSQLTDAQVSAVIRWIAADELHLFLDALGQFAEETNDDDMVRMFAPRRQLLEGLLLEKRVIRSRLFLGTRARASLRTSRGFIRGAASLDGSLNAAKALIYLDCGDFHIVEGSHNTKLWVYLRRPPEVLTAIQQTRYTYKELTTELADAFDAEYGPEASGRRTSIVHRSNWQYRFLGYLARHWVYIDPETVLSTSDYRRFRNTNEYQLLAIARSAQRP